MSSSEIGERMSKRVGAADGAAKIAADAAQAEPANADRTEKSATRPLDLPERRIMGSTMGVRICGVGAFAPDHEVTNASLAELGYDDDWIVRRTGIRSRRRADTETSTSDMVIPAARQCLQAAGVSPEQLDLIIVATMTPDHKTPSTACIVQRELGSSAAAFDLNAACAGFMYALITASQFIKSGVYQNVLVVGADLMTSTVDPEHPTTFPLFGDGCGAALLRPGEEDQGLLAFTLGADGRGGPLLFIPAGGTNESLTPEAFEQGRQFMQMDGRSVFKWAVRAVVETSKDVLQHAGVAASDVTWCIMHQANKRILDVVADGLQIPPDRVLMNLDRYGNTSAGSIPLVLDEAAREGKLQRGDLILFNGFGAGLSWGAGLYRW